MPKVRLARKQPITVDGVVLNGTRDFDLDLDLDAVDVTPWDSAFRGELPLTEAIGITLQILHDEDVQVFYAKWNKFPPQPLVVSVDGLTANFLVHKIKAGYPFSGAIGYEVTLKRWPYE